MSEVLNRDAKGSGETEISKLENTLSVDKQVLGLEISVEDLMLVALCNSIKQLVQEGL